MASSERRQPGPQWAVCRNLWLDLAADELPCLYKRKESAERCRVRQNQHDLKKRLQTGWHPSILPIANKTGAAILSPMLPEHWAAARPRSFVPTPPSEDPMRRTFKWVEEAPPHDPLCYLADDWNFSATEHQTYKMPHYMFASLPPRPAIDLMWAALEELWHLLAHENRPALWRSWQMHRHIAKLRLLIRNAFGDHISHEELWEGEYQMRVFSNGYAERLDHPHQAPSAAAGWAAAGPNIEQYRTEHSLNTEQFAALCKIDRKTLSKIRHGSPIRLDQIANIAKVMGISTEALFR